MSYWLKSAVMTGLFIFILAQMLIRKALRRALLGLFRPTVGWRSVRADLMQTGV